MESFTTERVVDEPVEEVEEPSVSERFLSILRQIDNATIIQASVGIYIGTMILAHAILTGVSPYQICRCY